jgi:hypothetical protein
VRYQAQAQVLQSRCRRCLVCDPSSPTYRLRLESQVSGTVDPLGNSWMVSLLRAISLKTLIKAGIGKG